MNLNRKVLLLAIVIGLGLLLGFASAGGPAQAAGPWFVKANGGNDGNNCLSPATACATIIGALNKPGFVPGDTIRVTLGAYTGTGANVLLLNKSVTLLGGWNESFTAQTGTSTLDGQQVRLDLRVNSGITATLERFTLQNAAGQGDGGGIYNLGTLTLKHTIIRKNSALCNGSAIYNEGTLTTDNTTISDNTADGRYCLGITVLNASSGVMILNKTVVKHNTPAGGIYNYGALTLNNSIVGYNLITGGANNAAGIYNWDGTTTLNNSAVTGNMGYQGGGIFTGGNGTGTVILNNSTVSGNIASEGGGIYNYSGIVILNNSTISGNRATTGGGVYNQGISVTLRNTILANNTATEAGPDCSGSLNSAGYNLVGNTSACTFTPSSGDRTGLEVGLRPLEGAPAYYLPLPTSPAINSGNPGGCADHLGNPLSIDQRGRPRVGRCDIGAVEVQALEASDKIANVVEAAPGQLLTYTVILKNIGNTVINKVVVTDTLPLGLNYEAGSLVAGSGSYGYIAGTITWTGSLNAGEVITLRYRATISHPSAPLIVNPVVINGSGQLITRKATVAVNGPVCNFTKHTGQPILSPGPNGAWDDMAVSEPTVLKDGNLYKMWYHGYDGQQSRIGYATSPDGLAWTKYGGNPVLSPEWWEGNRVFAPAVTFDGNSYQMWYSGGDFQGIASIGYATSTDGLIWAKYEFNPILGPGSAGSWDDKGVLSPAVLKVGNTYQMWYTGHNSQGLSRLGYATSSNGQTWTKAQANPALDLGSPGSWDWLEVYGPGVIKLGSTYQLWYSGQTLPPAWQTGYATSSNGQTWTRQSLLIPTGSQGTFDDTAADDSTILPDESNLKIWYSGFRKGGIYSIGQATAQICSAAPQLLSSKAIYLPIVVKKQGGSCSPDYFDDFSIPTSGWDVVDEGSFKSAYVGGEFQIQIKKPLWQVGITPGALATDFTAAVNARRTAGKNGVYGLIFGLNEAWNEFYRFQIDANAYSIWKYDHGIWTSLRGWTTTPAINTEANWNRLKVIRNGAQITVYVNDQFLTTVNDSSFTGPRRIGLIAISPQKGPLEFRFDNFGLYPGKCGVGAADTSIQMGKPEINTGSIEPKIGSFLE